MLRTRPGLRRCSNPSHDGSSCYGPARPFPSVAHPVLILADSAAPVVVPRSGPPSFGQPAFATGAHRPGPPSAFLRHLVGQPLACPLTVEAAAATGAGRATLRPRARKRPPASASNSAARLPLVGRLTNPGWRKRQAAGRALVGNPPGRRLLSSPPPSRAAQAPPRPPDAPVVT